MSSPKIKRRIQKRPGRAVDSSALLGCWTRQALNAGATLLIEPVMPGKAIFRATVSWPTEGAITVGPCLGIINTLETLEATLLEDAAKEMQESGAV